jgi:hypothetical protein
VRCIADLSIRSLISLSRSYEDIFGAGDEQWSLEDGVPVGFWEADCPKRIR